MNPETLKDHSPLDEEAFVFGAFRLLPAQRILLEEGKPLHLGSRALDVLIALVESAGDTIHKDKLIARVWPDTFVDEGNLRFQVATLRKALGDGRGGNRFIANIPGRGLHLCRTGDARACARRQRISERSASRQAVAGGLAV